MPRSQAVRCTVLRRYFPMPASDRPVESRRCDYRPPRLLCMARGFAEHRTAQRSFAPTLAPFRPDEARRCGCCPPQRQYKTQVLQVHHIAPSLLVPTPAQHRLPGSQRCGRLMSLLRSRYMLQVPLELCTGHSCSFPTRVRRLLAGAQRCGWRPPRRKCMLRGRLVCSTDRSSRIPTRVSHRQHAPSAPKRIPRPLRETPGLHPQVAARNGEGECSASPRATPRNY